jgi:hypothetical protein
MRTCINFGSNCVGCQLDCVDDRRCRGYCSGCINEDCDNHPHRAKEES